MDDLTKYCGRHIERPVELSTCDPVNNYSDCSRIYNIFVPNQICKHVDDNNVYGGGLIPMVFAVHCQLCHPSDMSYWGTIATQYQFVVIAPFGYDDTFNGQQCCGHAVEQNIDDVAFFQDVINQVDADFDFVSKDMVYGFGHKNGGYMVARAANLFRAIAPVAGYHVELPELKNPVGLFLHHAEDDQESRITGCCAANAIFLEENQDQRCSGGVENLLDTCTSAQDFVEDFGRDVNHCKGGNQVIHTDENLQVTCYEGIDCRANTTMCIYGKGADFPVAQNFPMNTDVAVFFARDACLLSQGSVWVSDLPNPHCVCKDANSTQIYCLNEIKANGFNNEVGDSSLFASVPFFLATVVLMVVGCIYYRRRSQKEDKYGSFFKLQQTVEMAHMMDDDEEDTPPPRVRLSGRI